MLSPQDVEMIRAGIKSEYFKVEQVIDYLNTHEIIGNDIFADVVVDPDHILARFMENFKDSIGYHPVSRNTFIRRIPFYFFYREDFEQNKNYVCFLGIIRRTPGYLEKDDEEEAAAFIEKRYQALEEIYYHFHISIEDIFTYVDNKEYRSDRDILMQWYDYLKLCEKLHWYDYTPDAFEFKYNTALEAAGMDPIIYDLEEILPGEYCFRDKSSLIIQGHFPVDPAGKPVLRWIGIKLKNPGNIRCELNEDYSSAWKIIISLTPKTELYAQNIYDAEDGYWYRLFAGPLTMEFDYTVLKKRRQWMGLTQKEVAEAVGATLRTYQKWEIGETTPDSKYLLRLLNWLDIRDVVDATKWDENWVSVEEDSK